jgi:molybdopterin-guanine dinucleotide biosynthesis protein A
MPRRCGIVLAGGLGDRLGLGVPKARVEIAGRSLLERAVATLAAACAEVVVVAPLDLDVGAVPARRVGDVPGFAGPLAGLVAGLEACGGANAAVLGVDFPLVVPALVAALLERLEAGAMDAVVPRPGRIPQPLVAAWSTAAAPRLRAALQAGETSLRGGLASLAVAWLDDAAIATLPGGIGALLNVNTPADLDVARGALEAPSPRTP